MSPDASPKALPFDRARVVAGNVGTELRTLRLRITKEIDQGGPFDAVMSARVGPATSELPFSLDSAISGVANWGKHLPYPQIAVEPKTGGIFLRDGSRSPSWYGPFRPTRGALVTGRLSDAQRVELGLLLTSKSGAFSV